MKDVDYSKGLHCFSVIKKRKRPKMGAGMRRNIYKRDKYTCLRCGSKTNLTIDHIIPFSKGGKNSKSNTQTLCQDCNKWKGTQTIDFRK